MAKLITGQCSLPYPLYSLNLLLLTLNLSLLSISLFCFTFQPFNQAAVVQPSTPGIKMEGICTRCKLAASYKYWHEHSPTKQKFFKVMAHDFERQLTLPDKFAECFRGKIARECTIRGPSGNEWNIRLERTNEGQIVMSNGWDNFVRDNGLRSYDFLTFRYLGSSATFKVSVYTPSGCEREEAYFAMNRNSNGTNTCTSRLHGREGGHGFQSLFEGHDQIDDDQESDDATVMSSIEQHNRCTKRKGKSMRNGTKKKTRLVSDGVIHISDDEGESSRAKQPQTYYISNRRSVTEEEKKTAHELAMTHIKSRKQSGVPMFAATMSQTNVYIGHNLTIPKEWALKHMLHEPHEIEIRVPGETDSWTVGCRWTTSQQCHIRAKWPRFVLENNLEEHDVCVFELVQTGQSRRKKTPVFVVKIFRVVPEVVQLEVSRSVV